jgi:hypothetical protein
VLGLRSSAKGILDSSICDTLSPRPPKSFGLHFEAGQNTLNAVSLLTPRL